MRLRTHILIMLAAIAAFFLLAGPALAAYATEADMIDAEILAPHHSEITGAMVMQASAWYGIPAHILLAVMGAETSCGDPSPTQGGRLISEGTHNYGCLKAGIHPKVTELSNGKITIGGRVFSTFPTMAYGVMALGRYLKVGTLYCPGVYRRCFALEDWHEPFAAVYYGRNVAGFSKYVGEIKAIDARFCAIAQANGYVW